MTTLRTPAQLCEHGLAPPDERVALEAVAARYAVALPAALGAIDRSDRSARSDRAPVRSRSRPNLIHRPGRNSPTRSATMPIARSKVSFIAIPIACCSSSPTFARSIAASVFAAKWSARANRLRCRQRRWLRALDYIRDASGNLGSDPHRRRSAGAVAAAAARR